VALLDTDSRLVHEYNNLFCEQTTRAHCNTKKSMISFAVPNRANFEGTFSGVFATDWSQTYRKSIPTHCFRFTNIHPMTSFAFIGSITIDNLRD